MICHDYAEHVVFSFAKTIKSEYYFLSYYNLVEYR